MGFITTSCWWWLAGVRPMRPGAVVECQLGLGCVAARWVLRAVVVCRGCGQARAAPWRGGTSARPGAVPGRWGRCGDGVSCGPAARSGAGGPARRPAGRRLGGPWRGTRGRSWPAPFGGGCDWWPGGGNRPSCRFPPSPVAWGLPTRDGPRDHSPKSPGPPGSSGVPRTDATGRGGPAGSRGRAGPMATFPAGLRSLVLAGPGPRRLWAWPCPCRAGARVVGRGVGGGGAAWARVRGIAAAAADRGRADPGGAGRGGGGEPAGGQ